MKKIYLMLLLICTACAFTACSDDDDEITTGNPVKEIKVPVLVAAGSDVTVNGKGFTDQSKIFLRDEDGETMEMTVRSFTKADLTFAVPETLTTGNYTVVLKQDGEWELRLIYITAKMPITDYKVPAEAIIGDTLKIVGAGFEDSPQIYLETSADTPEKIKMDNVKPVEGGLHIPIPDNFAKGSYVLYVYQNEQYWPLGDVRLIEPVLKPLSMITIVNFYEEDNGTYEITWNDEGRIKELNKWKIDYSEANKVVMTMHADQYGWSENYDATTIYNLTGGVAENGTNKATYDEEGEHYEEESNYAMEYTGDGYLNWMTAHEIVYGEPLDTKNTYTTEGDLITALEFFDMDMWANRKCEFDYSERSFPNTTEGIDLFALISEKLSLPDFNLRLLGIAGKHSAQLPGKITVYYLDEEGNPEEDPDIYQLYYEHNAKGQLTKVTMEYYSYGELSEYDSLIYTLDYE